MKIYWELKEIPRPENSYIGRTDGRVYILENPNVSFDESKRIVIGRATGETMMHPNDNYRYKFPKLWEEYYGVKLKHHVLNSGLYALTLGIVHSNELYPLLNDIIGPQFSNFLMDFSMYSIANRSNVAMNFKTTMDKQVCFSRKLFNDTRISDFLKNDISEEHTMNFRHNWMDQCKKNGVNNAWISIDGSNNDCNAEKCEIAQLGHSKSKKNNPVVSYMYAVSAKDGLPISYIEYEGSKVDSKAFMKLINMLKNHDIGVNGIILDRGFATADVVKILTELNYPYIIMLKSNVSAHKYMFDKYAYKLQWDGEYVLNDELLCGVCEKHQLFNNNSASSYINLYYDSTNALGRTKALFKKIFKTKEYIQECINKGIESDVIPSMQQYYKVTSDSVNFNYDELTVARHIKGLSSIASSQELTPLEVNNIYHLRDSSETQFSTIKTFLGSHVTRTHTTKSIRTKYFVTFISSIIRAEMVNACKKYDMPTTKFLSSINSLEMLLQSDGTYVAIHNESNNIKTVLNNYDITTSSLDAIAYDINSRDNNSMVSQVRKLPKVLKKKRGRPKGTTKPKVIKPKGKPGRPKGSKNKKKK